MCSVAPVSKHSQDKMITYANNQRIVGMSVADGRVFKVKLTAV